MFGYWSSRRYEFNGCTCLNSQINGMENWTNPKEYFMGSFRILEPSSFGITVNESIIILGKSVVEFTINNESRRVTFNKTKTTLKQNISTI